MRAKHLAKSLAIVNSQQTIATQYIYKTQLNYRNTKNPTLCQIFPNIFHFEQYFSAILPKMLYS